MIDALELFDIGFSWGGAHSLAVPYRVAVPGGTPRDAARDPFFRTRTTGAVAKRLGRRWIGIER